MPATAPIRVMTVDDHPLMREGIAALLAAHDGLELVGEAADGQAAVEAFAALRPDVVLMDLQMPELDGAAAIARIVAQSPDARVLVLTTYRGDAQARRAFAAGASGYLLKNAIRRELVEAIRQVHAGRRYLPAEVAAELGQYALQDELSARELDVLRRLAQGGSNRDIGAELGLSEDTVKTHMKAILSKLHAADRTQAVVIAIRRGIVDVWN
ncbi:response regulator transcription factor [Roseateles asaccharophilus]|uniref:DNA-binding NarL/FixJ family response regulator n=1 Tax=Roseateles asaccharophilus TaxID=582607 RepID=A0ABU2A7A7_9BURK|nr:response regulator transcription factor [Roseateles asaccharophilus]MDR7333054.1 DNA-binding NarL/FixJ family response regulator [Roseateles asaccharophilus]